VRFVACSVAGERDDRRIQRLIVEQAKERDLHVCAWEPCSRRRVSAVLDIADPHAGLDVGRCRAVDDEFRPPVIK
jgi:hypothetical protein